MAPQLLYTSLVETRQQRSVRHNLGALSTDLNGSASTMKVSKKFWIAGAASAVAVGLAGGIFGAFLSVAHPALNSSTTNVKSEPVTIEPGTPILLFNNGEAHASVKVDRNGLILLNLTTKTGQNQIALGVLGDSKLELGVFDSLGKARAGMEVPMKDSGRVHMLLLDKHDASHGSRTFVQS